MKRLINFRVSLVAAVAFVLGIIAFYELLFGEIVFGVVLAAILLTWLFLSLFKWRNMRTAAIVAIVFVLLGLGRSLLFYVARADEAVERPVTLTGRVTDVGRNGETYGTVCYLENCSDANGTTYRGKIAVRFGDEQPSAGDVVTAEGVLYSVYSVKADVDSYNIRNNVRYELQDPRVIAVEAGNLKVDETVRRYVYETTFQYMPNNGGLMYALLTGDRNAVDSSVQWVFSRAGIAHLLSVSGLHVGFVAAVLAFALKRLRMRTWAECLIVCVPLLFYAYVCGFAPSVVRALIMLVCSYLSRILLSRYDMLSSVSWAALLTLTICPFYLFDIGFQLSFMSVFGIAALNVPFNAFLARKKVNIHLRRLLGVLTVSMCCVAATVTVLAFNGEEIAPFGVLLNVLAVPAVSVAFVAGLFGLLPWVFHYLLLVSDAVLQTVEFVAERVATLSFATFAFKATVWSVVSVFALLFAAGGFVRLGKLGRKIYYPICCFLLCLSILFAYVPRRSQLRAYVVTTDNDSMVAMLSESGEAAVVGDFADFGAVRQIIDELSGFRVKSLSVYLSHYALADPEAVKAAVNRFDVNCVYQLDGGANDAVTHFLQSVGKEVVRRQPDGETGGDVAVRVVRDGILRAVCVRSGTLEVCLVYGDRPYKAATDLGSDIYVLAQADEAFSAARLPTLTPCQSQLAFNYGANKYGNFTITQKGDKINLSFR